MSAVAERGANGRPTAAAPAPAMGDAVPAVPFDHEQLIVRRGARSGAHVIVAIHSTALGPALGGVRMWHYPGVEDAVRDALRLADGMTWKAAAAGLELGGGKGVIRLPEPTPPAPETRRGALLDFADLVESLGGRYITAEDVGMSPEDLVTIRQRTQHVTGLPPAHGGSGDPSPFTALGLEVAMKACARERFGSDDLEGRRVAIIGLGHVGSWLARRLTVDGADLLVCDIDPAKRHLADELGATWLDPAEATLAECDVLAPCALGGAIDRHNVSLLGCEIVCGSANNQLAEQGLDEALAERGILYAPDFIVNAGGLIHVYKEIRGYSEQRARQLVLGIGRTIATTLATARARETTPLRAALELAHERIEATRPAEAPAVA